MKHWYDNYIPEGFAVENFPYGNLNDLNLDWILRTMKKHEYVFHRLKDIIQDMINESLSDLVYEQVIPLLGFVNVKNPPTPLVGMNGDGVTDDTAALSAIMDYAHENGKCLLYFPAGTYAVDSINMYEGSLFIGECRKDTVIFLRPNQQDICAINANSHTAVYNMTINGNQASQTENISGFMTKETVEDITVAAVTFVNCWAGINVDSECTKFEVSNVSVENGYVHGIYLNGSYGEDIDIHDVSVGNFIGNMEKGYCLYNTMNGIFGARLHLYSNNAAQALNNSGDYCYFSPCYKDKNIGYTNTGSMCEIKFCGVTAEIEIDFSKGSYETKWLSVSDNYNVNVGNMDVASEGEVGVRAKDVSMITNTTSMTSTGDTTIQSDDNITIGAQNNINMTGENVTSTASGTNRIAGAVFIDSVIPARYSETHTAGMFFDAVTYKDTAGEDYESLVDKGSSDAIKKYIDDSVAGASGDLTEEINNLSNRVTTNEQNIDHNGDLIASETAAREQQFTILDNKIQTETNQRAAEDLQLSERINTLANTENSHYTELTTSITNEMTAREEADAQLNSRIDSLSGAISGDFTEIERRVTKNENDIAGLNTTVGAMDTRLETAEDDINSLGEQVQNVMEVSERAETNAASALEKATTADENSATALSTANTAQNGVNNISNALNTSRNLFFRAAPHGATSMNITINANGYLYSSMVVKPDYPWAKTEPIVFYGMENSNASFLIAACGCYGGDTSGIHFAFKSVSPNNNSATIVGHVLGLTYAPYNARGIETDYYIHQYTDGHTENFSSYEEMLEAAKQEGESLENYVGFPEGYKSLYSN